MRSIINNKNGTALLVALLVMGVFVAISLALSSLILRETRITISFINAGQSYYTAESGIEIGLYGLNTQLPGWQPEYEEDGFKSFKLSDSTVGQFKLKNRCRAYPCFDEEEYDVASLYDVPKNFYDVLNLNQSLTIPLFVADDSGDVHDASDFVVEFFTPLNPKLHLKFGGSQNLSGWDVLRWKLIGIRNGEILSSDDAETFGGINETETISDFTAVSMLTVNSESEPDKIISANATAPSWFGTIDCDGGSVGGPIVDRYYNLIKCADFYLGGLKYGQEEIVFGGTDEQSKQISKIQSGVCLPWQAREFYVYDYTDGKKVSEVEGCYSIQKFLREHTLNYLVLTNLVNPAVLTDEFYGQKDKLSRLFFRVELGNVQSEDSDTDTDLAYTVRPVASITANGYSGDSSQSINVKVKRGSFMPVFNFSLYSTYIEGEYSDWYEGLTPSP